MLEVDVPDQPLKRPTTNETRREDEEDVDLLATERHETAPREFREQDDRYPFSRCTESRPGNEAEVDRRGHHHDRDEERSDECANGESAFVRRSLELGVHAVFFSLGGDLVFVAWRRLRGITAGPSELSENAGPFRSVLVRTVFVCAVFVSHRAPTTNGSWYRTVPSSYRFTPVSLRQRRARWRGARRR